MISSPFHRAALVGGLILACWSRVSAATYSQNFNAFANGTTSLGDGSVISSATPGNASVQAGQLRLTNDAIGSENGSYIIPALPGASLGWTATFDLTIIDAAGENPPADGVSFNWGALTGTLSTNSQGSEHGWNNADVHIAYEVDTWMNGGGDNGLRIASYPAGAEVLHASQPGNVLNDGTSVTGNVTVSWNPVNGASMTTTGFVSNVNFG